MSHAPLFGSLGLLLAGIVFVPVFSTYTHPEQESATAVHIRNHAWSGNVAADGHIEFSDEPVKLMAQSTPDLMRKSLDKQSTDNADIELSNGLVDSTPKLSPQLVRKSPEERVRVGADGSIEKVPPAPAIPPPPPSLAEAAVTVPRAFACGHCDNEGTCAVTHASHDQTQHGGSGAPDGTCEADAMSLNAAAGTSGIDCGTHPDQYPNLRSNARTNIQLCETQATAMNNAFGVTFTCPQSGYGNQINFRLKNCQDAIAAVNGLQTEANLQNLSFQLRGRSGVERVTITVGNQTSTHTLTTDFQTFTYPFPSGDFYKVRFNNDYSNRDVYFNAVTPTSNTIELPLHWSTWSCGSVDENIRCNRVRSGVFAWTGTYKIFPSKASTGIPSNGLVFSIRASESTASVITDSVAGLTIGGKSITTHEGHSCWNLDNDYLQRSGGSSLTEGQFYTHAVWVYWRASDSGWRTLMRPSQDHSILIQYGGKSLGMYSNRNGGWKDSGYDITSDMSGWQLVVVTGAGSSSTSSTGTSTFYTGVAGQSAMTHIGTADRVVSGTTWYRLGWGGQGPGKVAAAYEWNRVLSAAELDGLLQAGVEPGIPSQAVCLPDAYTSCPSLGCSVNWAPYCQTTCRYNGCVAAPTPAPTPAPTTPAPTTPAPTTPAPTPAPIPSNFACTLWKGRADNNFNGDPGSCVNWTNDTYLFTGCPYGALNWPADGSKSDVFINNLMAARPELDFSVSWRQKPLYCDRPWNCNGDCWWAGVGCSGTHTAANNCSALVSTLNNEYGTTFFCLGPLMGHYYLASKDCDGNLAVLNGPELTPATPLPPTPTASPPTAAPTGAPTFVGIGANCPSGYTKKTPNQANKHCGWSTRQCNGHAYPSTDIRRQQCPGNAYCVLGPTNGKLTMPNGTNINSIFVHRRRNANIGYTNCFDGCEIALDDNDYVTAAYGDIHSLCKEKCDAWSLWCVSYVVIPSNTEYRGQANKQPYCFLGSNCSSCSHWGNSKYTNPAGEEAFVCERNPTPLPTPPPTLAPISYSEHTVSSTFWDDGTTICSRVTTQAGCEIAAGGPLSGSGSWSNQPVGCIKTGGKYYLNTRSAGYAQSGTIIVCAQA